MWLLSYTKKSFNNKLQSNLCIRTPASSSFLSTKASLNSSRENRIDSFCPSEQRPPGNKGHFCYSLWLTLVNRFDCTINQLIIGRLMWGRGAIVSGILRRPRLQPERRAMICQLIMISSRLSLEKKIQKLFKRYVVVSGNNIPGTGSLRIQASS